MILVGSLTLALAAGVSAADQDTQEQALDLSPVVVVATKSPRPLGDVAGTVTVIDGERMERELVRSIHDMVRYEPGIDVEGGSGRFGGQGFNIRGIGGNRVAIEVDGVPVSDQFDIGSYSNAGRDLVDVALLNRVEILRGPASTLYGSDAIGGVVAYWTHDPADLARGNGSPALSFNSAWHGSDNAASAGLTVATLNDRLGLLGSINYREGQEFEPSALTGPADHKDYESLAGFGKLTLELDGNQRLSFTADHHRRDDLSDIRSLLGQGRFRSTTLLTGDDEQERNRVSARYETLAEGSLFEDASVLAWYQDSATDQFTVEERASRNLRRERLFSFSQESLGVEFNFSRNLTVGATRHVLGYGLEVIATDTQERRDAVEIDLLSQERSNSILGETFPVRDFPNTDTLEAGLYLQDEISFADGRWTVIPALRFDHYELDPRPDALYREDFPDTEVVGVSESELSPKLGFVFDAGSGWSLFGQYARGFRAPPFEDVNIGLEIPLFNIRAIPNPELKSETSDGFELGARYRVRGTSLSLSGFHTRYDDFIETKVALGPDPATGTLLFQSRNIAEAHVYGAELRLEQALGAWFEPLEDFDLDLAASWTRGRNDVSNQPLNSIQPAEAVIGLAWRSPRIPLSTRLSARLVEAQDAVDETATELFKPAGYGVLDLSASYAPSPGLTLRAGLFNLADKTYWRWSQVQGLEPDDPLVPIFSAPGRHAAVSLSLKW